MSFLVLAAGSFVLADWWQTVPPETRATYVGRDTCMQCHQQQHRQWEGSYHDLAMDLATEDTVLGDFNDAELTHHDVSSRMFRRDGKYMIHTEGPDGEMGDFEIKYVFGVDPLQQYMVEFDRTDEMPADEIARVQVLRISWDTKRKKWFYLPPPDVDEKLSPDDDLHWTGIAQRWNNMCADCHSTNLQKNFDTQTASYHTTFSEIDVSCEACHGPGSVHVELASSKSLFWDRKQGYGLANLKSSDPKVEIQTCAQCHSRRRIVHADFRPGDDFYDHFANELLMENTYHANGEILDEVYVYGSFLQSKMFHKGVRCTDCHDPHTTKVKFEDNRLCTSCHAHPAGKYDAPSHHHHEAGSRGASCVECHMPETTYMEVDPRRDHGLRVPRPDLSVQLGTPNACTRCHLELPDGQAPERPDLTQYQDWVLAARSGDEQAKDVLGRLDRWAADYAEQWYGEKPQDGHFALALAAARRQDPAAENQLIALAQNLQVPAIVRATAVMELNRYASAEALAAARRSLEDPDPQVRAAALNQVQALSDGELAEAVVPLLSDPSRLVRTEAARVLARVPGELLTGTQRRARESAVEELVAGMEVNNDRAGSHMTLGILHENLGDDAEAIRAYETAIRTEPAVTGPRTNLAALLERLSRDADQRARQAARGGDRQQLESAAQEVVQHRQRVAELRSEELKLLERDARLAPDNAAIQYRYGLSLYLHGRQDDAEAALGKAVELEPRTAEFLLALTLLHQKRNRFEDALQGAEQLVQLQPENASYRQLLEDIRLQVRRPAAEPPK